MADSKGHPATISRFEIALTTGALLTNRLHHHNMVYELILFPGIIAKLGSVIHLFHEDWLTKKPTRN